MIKIIHFGIHNTENKNSGDTVLFKLTQKLFNTFQSNIEWTNKNLWEPIDQEDIKKINLNFDYLLIGGGGLLLRDQKGAENSISGWQFNCSTELIKKISIPVIVFGIGYNRFRRQDDFLDVFKENINALIKKSIFFGLRNNGSIKKLKEYLTPENSKKISLQHCPTVILDLIENVKTKPINKIEKISINFAYDRPKNRFIDENLILKETSLFIKFLIERDYKIDICLHKEVDMIIMGYLDNFSKEKINIVDLSIKGYNDIITYYKNIDLAIGMRGHSQMIPFGISKNIISIISHDKLGYFLEDVNLSEYGIDVDDMNFFNNLRNVFIKIENKFNYQLSQIHDQKEIIYMNTKKNIEKIFDNVQEI